jgi:hypothetical protein
MKKIILILICEAISLTLFSQGDQLSKSTFNSDMNTILGNKGESHVISLGYFIEINGGYSQFGNQNVLLPGISLGILLNHQWTIGLAGNFIDNPNGLHIPNVYYDSINHNMHEAVLNGGYGGFLLEYTLFPKSRIHIAFPLMIGDGYMYYSRIPYYNGQTHSNHYWHHNYLSSDNFFVIEPGVRMEFNMIKFLRLGLSICYRYTPDLKLLNTSGELINQFTGKISLRFGQF